MSTSANDRRDGTGAAEYPWIGAEDKQYIEYMKSEWGVPVRNDKKLFEMLALECFQAGLSWAIVLKRRRAFRKAFSNFNIEKIAKYDDRDRRRLINDESIIRNKRKIDAVIANARATLAVKKEFGSLSAYLWSFVNDRPIERNKGLLRWEDLPVQSEESRELARDMKKRGFKFVGSISCYAFMQATGLVNDRIKG